MEMLQMSLNLKAWNLTRMNILMVTKTVGSNSDYDDTRPLVQTEDHCLPNFDDESSACQGGGKDYQPTFLEIK